MKITCVLLLFLFSPSSLSVLVLKCDRFTAMWCNDTQTERLLLERSGTSSDSISSISISSSYIIHSTTTITYISTSDVIIFEFYFVYFVFILLLFFFVLPIEIHSRLPLYTIVDVFVFHCAWFQFSRWIFAFGANFYSKHYLVHSFEILWYIRSILNWIHAMPRIYLCRIPL